MSNPGFPGGVPVDPQAQVPPAPPPPGYTGDVPIPPVAGPSGTQPGAAPPVLPTVENILATLTLLQQQQQEMMSQFIQNSAQTQATQSSHSEEPKANKPFVFRGDHHDCAN